jgi:hypothetical protein
MIHFAMSYVCSSDGMYISDVTNATKTYAMRQIIRQMDAGYMAYLEQQLQITREM